MIVLSAAIDVQRSDFAFGSGTAARTIDASIQSVAPEGI
jgi:hypothetical protein